MDGSSITLRSEFGQRRTSVLPWISTETQVEDTPIPRSLGYQTRVQTDVGTCLEVLLGIARGPEGKPRITVSVRTMSGGWMLCEVAGRYELLPAQAIRSAPASTTRDPE